MAVSAEPTVKEASVSRCGDIYENKVTGERAVVLRGDEDGEGRSVLVHLTVRPTGAVVGEHIHPKIRERFYVISGRLGPVARMRGYCGLYPEYSRPHGRITPDPAVLTIAGLAPPGSPGPDAEA